jgi:hypothetical protein
MYATTDGEQYFRKERAFTSFTNGRDTIAAVEARRMAEVHDPNNIISRVEILCCMHSLYSAHQF